MQIGKGDPVLVDQILRRAERLVSDGWCRGMLACDEAGVKTTPETPVASRFSLEGALLLAGLEATGSRTSPEEDDASHWVILGIADCFGCWGLEDDFGSVNDEHSQDEIVELLEYAAGQAKGQAERG